MTAPDSAALCVEGSLPHHAQRRRRDHERAHIVARSPDRARRLCCSINRSDPVVIASRSLPKRSRSKRIDGCALAARASRFAGDGLVNQSTPRDSPRCRLVSKPGPANAWQYSPVPLDRDQRAPQLEASNRTSAVDDRFVLTTGASPLWGCRAWPEPPSERQKTMRPAALARARARFEPWGACHSSS